MKTKLIWEENIVSNLTFSLNLMTLNTQIQFGQFVFHLVIWIYFKDGLFVLVAVADRILFYKADTMEYDNYVKGHKDVVNCIAFSKDS